MTADLVTVYRSTELNAEQDATVVKNMLMEAGVAAVLLDDTHAGVEPGTFAVSVPSSEVEQAQSVLDTIDIEDEDTFDPSAALDMEVVLETQGATGEMEAMAVQSILDANGINAVLVGSSTLPSFTFQVRVAADDLEKARTVIAEAQAAGPAAAIEGERQSELPIE